MVDAYDTVKLIKDRQCSSRVYYFMKPLKQITDKQDLEKCKMLNSEINKETGKLEYIGGCKDKQYKYMKDYIVA